MRRDPVDEEEDQDNGSDDAGRDRQPEGGGEVVGSGVAAGSDAEEGESEDVDDDVHDEGEEGEEGEEALRGGEMGLMGVLGRCWDGLETYKMYLKHSQQHRHVGEHRQRESGRSTQNDEGRVLPRMFYDSLRVLLDVPKLSQPRKREEEDPRHEQRRREGREAMRLLLEPASDGRLVGVVGSVGSAGRGGGVELEDFEVEVDHDGGDGRRSGE